MKPSKIAALIARLPSRVQVDPYLDSTADAIFLPSNEIIRFHTDTGPIDVQLRNGELTVSTLGFGEYNVIAVLPEASNMLTIRGVKK